MKNKEKEYEEIKKLFKNSLKLSLDKEDEKNREIYEHLIYWLSQLYKKADWHKIARSKNVYPTDTFQNVIKSSSYKKNFKRINNKICEGLGIQYLPISSEVIDFLELNKSIGLSILRNESIYLSLKSMEISKIKILNEEKKEEEEYK